MHRTGDKDLSETMPRSPFQTPVVAPERSGCQIVDERVEQRNEQAHWELYSSKIVRQRVEGQQKTDLCPPQPPLSKTGSAYYLLKQKQINQVTMTDSKQSQRTKNEHQTENL